LALAHVSQSLVVVIVGLNLGFRFEKFDSFTCDIANEFLNAHVSLFLVAQSLVVAVVG
jgi:hypothetical protein